jgi:hypothetical protein
LPYIQANTNNPFGFQPVESASVPAPTRMYQTSTDNVEIGMGDLVVVTTGGFVAKALSGASGIVSGTGANQILGVAAQYMAALSTDGRLLVYDDPDQNYVVQDNGAATSGMQRISIGQSFSVNVTATANAFTGRSAMVLLSTSNVGSTAGRPVKVIAMHPIEGTSFPTASGQWRKWIVKLASIQNPPVAAI